MSVTLGHKDRASNVGHIFTDVEEFTTWQGGGFSQDASPVLAYLWDRPGDDLRFYSPLVPLRQNFWMPGGVGGFGTPEPGAGTVEGPLFAVTAEFVLSDFVQVGLDHFGTPQSDASYPSTDIAWTVPLPVYDYVQSLGPFPKFTARPVISGDPVIGQTLTLDAINGENYTTVTYQWFAGDLANFANGFIGGQVIDGETGASYVVADSGGYPYRACAVTITTDKGSSVRKLSNVLGPVAV